MPSIDDCLEQIDMVRDAADDPKAAYVIRSRLERLLLTCSRVAAEADGRDVPDRLTGFAAQSPGRLQQVVTVAGKLYDLSANICQPSESFDVRWDEGWRRIEAALNELEHALRATTAAPSR